MEIAYNIKTAEKRVEDSLLSYEHEEPVMSRGDGAEQCIEYGD